MTVPQQLCFSVPLADDLYRNEYMKMMDSLSISETRANLKAVMDRVVADRIPITIRRRGGENVVMVSQADWEAMAETLYLLQSPRNAERLIEAIEGLDRGKGVERELIEP